MAYATEAQLRTQIERDGTTGAGTATNLALLLQAASDLVDGVCNKRPGSFVAEAVASPRSYSGSGTPVLYIDECIAITLVEVRPSISGNYAAWAVTDWLAFQGVARYPDFNTTPYNGIMVAPGGSQSHFLSGKFDNWPGFSPLEEEGQRDTPTVRVTARWGYAASAPALVTEATIVQAARWFKRGESAWADTLASPDFGSLQFRQSLDPDLVAMLIKARLVRPAVGGSRRG